MFFKDGICNSYGDRLLVISQPDNSGRKTKYQKEVVDRFGHRTGEIQYFKKILMNGDGKTYDDFYAFNLMNGGYVAIQKTQDSGWRLLSLDFSSLSEEFYEIAFEASMFGSYKGMSLVRRTKDSKWQFRNKKGEFSPELHHVGTAGFSGGFAVVKVNENEGYRYLSTDFNLSEEFFQAETCCNSMMLVKKTKNSNWQYRDQEGNLSEEFIEAEKYGPNGFAKVRPFDSKPKWRDLLGNLSDKQTQLGKDYYDYYLSNKTVYDLCDECFGDDKFLERILLQEKEDLEYYCDKCNTQEELDALYEKADDISDYVKGKAYEQYLKKQEELNSKKQPVEVKDTPKIDKVSKEKKEEMKEKLGKIF